MDLEIMTALIVILFGALGVVLVTGWLIQTWIDEIARNRRRGAGAARAAGPGGPQATASGRGDGSTADDA